MSRGSPEGVVARSVRLDPVPESAGQARRIVTEVVDAAGCVDLADAATLLVSELVTNAILHARTQIEVVVAASRDGLRVGVNDHSPQLPARRDYQEGATTGRGLEMVELVASGYGADTHEDGSKTVWFELGTAAPGGPEAQPAPPSGRPVEVVVLQNVPWETARAWQEHADALLREALLAAWELDGDLGPGLAPVSAAGEAFAELAAALDAAAPPPAAEPRAAGPGTRQRADLVLALSPSGVASFLALGPALDGAAELARQGLLLAPATPPGVRAFREWVTAEVAAQVLGAPATAWREPV